MIATPDWQTEMRDLLDRLQDGGFGDTDRVRLNDMLRAGEAQRDFFITYMDVHSRLAWEGGHEPANEPPRHIDLESEISNPAFPALSPSPTLSTNHYPLTTDFVGGPVFSYMVASVVLCAMLLGAWAYKVTHVANLPGDMANQPRKETPHIPAAIGQITGMKDCRWGKGEAGTIVGASVPLGRKYTLESGLLQIAYKTGANVILEGPCEYTADSSDGGYLRVGKLVARVEKNDELRMMSDESKKHPSDIYHSSFINHHLFAIHTPTAVVTDLGTEFGIEVNGEGDTASIVFSGSVRVRMIGGGNEEKVLRENESAIVSSNARQLRSFAGDTAGISSKFVRRLPDNPVFADLLDIVAGGNGWSRRREHGVDAVTGEVDFEFAEKRRHGEGRYVRVAWSTLIDGVFIPSGAGSVQIDSAGHEFEDFPKTSNLTYGSLFARAAEIAPGKSENELKHWAYRIGRCKEFMPEDRGLLTFCPNVGITFDLEAMRKNNPGIRPSRLLATVGMGDVRPYYPEAGNLADFWVFIDGRLKFKRAKLTPEDGAIGVDVGIGPGDRFLTLVSTNAEGSDSCDWVVVGDPVLQMDPASATHK